MIKRRPKNLEPDLEEFNKALMHVAGVADMDGLDIAKLFRHFFLGDENEQGKKVLFLLLTWCGEYEVDDPDDPNGRIPPTDPALLQRWAGKREIAAKIRAALYADLRDPTLL